MDSVENVIACLADKGISVQLQDGKLKARAARGTLTDELSELIRSRRESSSVTSAAIRVCPRWRRLLLLPFNMMAGLFRSLLPNSDSGLSTVLTEAAANTTCRCC